MTMTPVKSSNIHSVGYDAPTETMRVRFLSGATHQYRPVPGWAHRSFVNAPSIGSHFAEHVRGRYESKRVDK